MISVPIYNESDDVLGWIIKIKAKLISKGYKSVLTDSNRPMAANARTAWDALADKTVGTIMLCLFSEVAVQFEDKVTPQSLIDALRSHYMPDQ